MHYLLLGGEFFQDPNVNFFSSGHELFQDPNVNISSSGGELFQDSNVKFSLPVENWFMILITISLRRVVQCYQLCYHVLIQNWNFTYKFIKVWKKDLDES